MIYQQIVLHFDKVNLLFYLLFYYYIFIVNPLELYVCLPFVLYIIHARSHT